MNLPIALNETSAADDITGKNACPIWLRITAMMQAAPFEADPMEGKRKYIEAKRFDAMMHSEKHRIKKNSIKIWTIIRGVFYECTSLVAFVLLARGTKDRARNKCSAAKRAVDRAKAANRDSFIYLGHVAYLKKPEGSGVPVRYVGIDFP
jgi:hypothetical protein